MTTQQTPPDTAKAASRSARWKLFAILAICAAPVIASYLTYYVIQPQGRTNYGALLEPPGAIAELQVTAADGASASLAPVRGKWVMVAVDPGPCAKACAERLFAIRQVRLTTGKDRDRIERALLLTGTASPDPGLLAEHEGMLVLRVQAEALARQFPAGDGGAASDHIYIVDPLGNVMMRFPRSVDPNRMKKDIAKLLRASRIG